MALVIQTASPSVQIASGAPDPVPSPKPWTDEVKREVIRKMAEGLRYWYIDAQLGNQMAALIERNFAAGLYQHADPVAFKDQVLKDLLSIYPDKHLHIRFELAPISPDDPDRLLRDWKEEELTPAQRACLVPLAAPADWIQSKVLPGNIGYLEIKSFPHPVDEEEIARAMAPLLNTQALIIDLRQNFGGSPLTVSKVASHLFEEKTLLTRVYQRSTNQTEEFYTQPKEAAYEKPIYVLIGKETMSGGEELAYDLQATKRATLIGQNTWGGAHPYKNYVVHDHLFISIPNQRAINPYTGTNWEGPLGVRPDQECAGDSLALACASLQDTPA